MITPSKSIDVTRAKMSAAIVSLDADREHLMRDAVVPHGPDLQNGFDHLRLKMSRARQAGTLTLTGGECEFVRASLAAAECGCERPPVRSLLDKLQ